MPQFCLIHNRQSGSSSSLSEVIQLIKDRQLEVKLVELKPGWQTLVKQQIGLGCQTFVAAGGDGTVNCVAQMLHDTGLKLGVLPLGTFNHFAKDLGIPTEIEPALNLIIHGPAKLVDTGLVNDEVFVNNSTVGLYPKLVQAKPKAGGILSRLLLSVPSSLMSLIRLRPYRIELTVDGRPARKTRASFIFVGNNDYQATRAGFSNRRSITEGILSFYLVSSSRSLKIAWLFLKSLLGKAGPRDGFDHQVVRSATISFKGPRVEVSLDGELKTLKTPLSYRTSPKSLKVLAPN